MAGQDASVAIQNALQKLDQQPNLVRNDESLKSVKLKLQRLGFNIDKLNSVSELTQVREFAYDVEDIMDDAILVAAAAASSAHQRWRKLGNLFLFFSGPSRISQQLVEEEIEQIYKRTASIGSSTIDEAEETAAEEHNEAAETAHEKNLFYLSLSGFPSDVEISARKMVQRWVAEGFLDRQGSNPMEEQGREKINWLLKKGFITQAQTGTCGNIKTFMIEREKLETCISAAEKENFLHVITDTAGENNEITVKLEATRLAIHTQRTNLFTGNNLRDFAVLSKVRSLQIHCTITISDYGFLNPRKKEFESLRVLDLGSLELETVPEAIGKLTHLRYVRLRAPDASKIPASVCNLPNLQTIDLKETKRVKTMPVEIWKMKKNLRHLHLGGSTALPPPRRSNHYDALQNLQTLCGVRPDRELKRLMVRAKFPNVNRLKLHTSKKDSVANKEEFLSFLNSLDLLYHLRSLTLRGPISGMPKDWNAFPGSLTKMTLVKSRIEVGSCMETLQNLPNLRCLKLMEESVRGEEMRCAGGGFPALEVMRMEGVKELERWTMEKGAMRLLGDLKVEGCDKFIRVKVFQPSKELSETLQRLERDHREIVVEVDPIETEK